MQILATCLLTALVCTKCISNVHGSCIWGNATGMLGQYYSLVSGLDTITTISNNELIVTVNVNSFEDKNSKEVLSYDCQVVLHHYLSDPMDVISVLSARVLYVARNKNCGVCYEFFYQTPNVMQYRRSSGCQTAELALCGQIVPFSHVATMFRIGLKPMNCKTLLEGVYHFTYEVDQGGGGACNSPDSHITACQLPGSAYQDNTFFYIQYGQCAGIASSQQAEMKYQCLGAWTDSSRNLWAALASTVENEMRYRFRCVNTNADQMRYDLRFRLGMSRMGDCNEVSNFYQAPNRFVLQPALTAAQLDEIRPTCVLPANFSGTWFTTAEYDADVVINDTHIFYHVQIDQFHWKDSYFTCKQLRESRYLMQAVTVGKCEIDFQCFDFMPRHHSLIRFRTGRPFRLLTNERSQFRNQNDYLVRMFRYSCAWQSFTFNAEDWTYKVFIMNPPTPVDCPIRGRYMFFMEGQEEEKYYSKLPGGLTKRPRMQVDCREEESDLAVCQNDPKHLKIQVRRCFTLDNIGRPLDEYIFPDNVLTCVGFWMEDMDSILITYDPDDPVSQNFRCWVYQRIDYKSFLMSRSVRALCEKNQSSRSSKPRDGASILLSLVDNEREFDNCPMFFDDGRDPYKAVHTIKVFGGRATRALPTTFIFTTLMILLTAYLTDLLTNFIVM